MGLRWTDAAAIAVLLAEMHPGIDPLKVRFTDLNKWVCDLDELKDYPGGSNEKVLEAIQMAWLDEMEG